MINLDQFDVETVMGTYSVSVFQDEDAGNPVTEWDHPNTEFVIWGANVIKTNTLGNSPASEAVSHWHSERMDAHEIARRFSLWKRFTGDDTVLAWFSDAYREGIALVAYDPQFPEWNRDEIAKLELQEYRKWADGEVYGFVAVDQNGDEFDDNSMWGIYGTEYVNSEATDAAIAHANEVFAELERQAAMVGAGFVGVI